MQELGSIHYIFGLIGELEATKGAEGRPSQYASASLPTLETVLS